jgi:hypothetical protein
MPRIRSLKPDFFKDDDLCIHPPWIRILYAGLWVQADREGRLEDRPVKLKAEIFPYDNFDLEKGLSLLCQPKKYSPAHEPFIVRYSVGNEKYIQIIKFHKHQTPHYTEKPSLIPPYSGGTPGVLLELPGGERDDQEQETINLTHISFPNRWDGIGEEDKAAWIKAYPACDIEIELAKMAEWLKANPTKKKSNYRRFITNWLSRSQDRGGTQRGQQVRQSATRPRTAEEVHASFEAARKQRGF